MTVERRITRPETGGSTAHRGWTEAVLRIAAHYGIAVSPERVRLDLAWSADSDRLRVLARSAGLSIREPDIRPEAISTLRLPLLVEFDNGEIGVVERETADGFGIALAGEKGLETPVSRADLTGRLRRLWHRHGYCPARHRSENLVLCRKGESWSRFGHKMSRRGFLFCESQSFQNQ